MNEAPITAAAERSTPRPRILLFDHTAVLSGGELALLSLVSQLDQRLYEPIVLIGQPGPLVDRMQHLVATHVLELDARVKDTRKDVMGWRTVVDPAKMWASATYVFRLAGKFNELRADVVHTNSLKSDLLGGLAAKMAGLPLIWHIRDRIADDYLPRRVVQVFRRLCRILPNRIIANSRSTLATLHLPNAQHSYVISSGFNTDRFREAGQRTESLAAALSSGLPIRIGVVGRISPWKGQEIFIRAAQQVHEAFPDTQFFIIGAPLFGEQEFETSLHALVEECHLGAAVHFTGFREDVATAIGELHILVHASTIAEPLGQVIAQGMAARKPVVATIGGGPSEIVSDRETGLMVPPGDAAAMAAAILDLLHHPDFAESLAERAQSYAMEQFSEAHVARQVERVYADLLGS